MLTISFKNVGQGDSIILEWDNKLAVIDCNLHNDTNPTLEHIASSGVKELEFVLLSHPHTDHFSGIRQVLEYCEANKIVIKNFYFTGGFPLTWIEDVVYDNESQLELAKLFDKADKLFEKIILDITPVQSTSGFSLTAGIDLKIIAPTHKEVKNVIVRNTRLRKKDNNNNNIPTANYLSTVIALVANENYILLTSDSPKRPFKILSEKSDFGTKNLVLIQVPHHGSKANFEKKFWLNVRKIKGTPSVFSVGTGYNHPDISVVRFLRTNDFTLHSTNFVGGLLEFFNEITSPSLLDIFPDATPSLLGPPELYGDKQFNFDGSLNPI